MEPPLNGRMKTVAYFYFNSNEAPKQSITTMLLSLIGQLLSDDSLAVVKPVHDLLLTGLRLPSQQACIQELQRLVSAKSSHKDVYLLIDAINESDDVSGALSQLGKLKDARVMMTCLDPISDELKVEATTIPIDLAPAIVESDIRSYIEICLAADPKLQRFSEVDKATILNQLSTNCDGM